MDSIDTNERPYSVWVGGFEVVGCFVTLAEAIRIAGRYRADGYEDVTVEYDRRVQR